MSEHIRLIVGLGNPGTKYRDTWHNLGFRVVEILANRLKSSFKAGRSECLVAETSRFGGVSMLLPTSYMNRSGTPVSAWMRYHKVEPQRLLVIYDDHDLPLGRIRLREGGSGGGHRGIEDIIRLLGTEDFPRIRMGIQTDTDSSDLADQVLTTIPPDLKGQVETIISTSVDAVESIISVGIVVAANKYNGFTIL